jgi:hypothetical protein
MNTPKINLPIDLAQRILDAARIAAALHVEQDCSQPRPQVHQPAGGADGAVGLARN